MNSNNNSYSIIKSLFGPMRLPFLILPPVCVALGAASAVWSGSRLNVDHLIFAFIGALSAHISVNCLNEYQDFKSGLDFKTQPTPFSGGSGTLPKNPERAYFALMTGLIALAVTALIGIYFLRVRGIWLLPLGLLGIIIIMFYTSWITKHPFLCLIAPGLGFGPLMVMGTNFALTGTYTLTSFIASLVPFFLVSNLLLLNPFPDVEADKGIGRRHLPISMGKKVSIRIYGGFLAGTYIAIVIGYISGAFPAQGFLGVASIFIAIPTFIGVTRYADNIPKLIPYMAKNVITVILTPALLSIGLFIA